MREPAHLWISSCMPCRRLFSTLFYTNLLQATKYSTSPQPLEVLCLLLQLVKDKPPHQYKTGRIPGRLLCCAMLWLTADFSFAKLFEYSSFHHELHCTYRRSPLGSQEYRLVRLLHHIHVIDDWFWTNLIKKLIDENTIITITLLCIYIVQFHHGQTVLPFHFFLQWDFNFHIIGFYMMVGLCLYSPFAWFFDKLILILSLSHVPTPFEMLIEITFPYSIRIRNVLLSNQNQVLTTLQIKPWNQRCRILLPSMGSIRWSYGWEVLSSTNPYRLCCL